MCLPATSENFEYANVLIYLNVNLKSQGDKLTNFFYNIPVINEENVSFYSLS